MFGDAPTMAQKSYKIQKMEIEKAWKPLQKNHRNKKLSKTRRKFKKKKDKMLL